MNLQPLWSGRRQAEISIFVENDELSICQDKTGFGKVACLPENLSGFDLNGRYETGTVVAARTIDGIANANDTPKVNPHSVVAPQLLNVSLIGVLAETKDSAPSLIGRGVEEPGPQTGILIARPYWVE